ncbi:MAG: DUF6675 family protein, partial [Rectinemataceae bacterium]
MTGSILSRLLLFATTLAVSTAAMAQPAAGKLSASDNSALNRGEAVVRLIRTAAQISLPSSAHGAEEIMASLSRLKPNYLVEVVVTESDRSESGDVESGDVIANLASILDNIPGYVGIPYVSSYNKRIYPLFDKAVVLLKSPKTDGASIEALMHMKPFDDYKARYAWNRGSDWLFFSGRNLDRLVYSGIAAVQKGEMLWYISAYHAKGRVWFHGIGAVRAFDLFGSVRSRLEPSFVGRTQAFFAAVGKRLK